MVRILINIIKTVVILVVSPILLIIFYVLIWFMCNIYSEGAFTNQLQDSLPIKTELLKTESISARLQGTGSGLEFLSVVLVKSELSQKELEEYYQYYYFDYAKLGMRYWGEPDKSTPYKVHRQIGVVNNLPIETLFSEDSRDILFFEDTEMNNFENIYFIAIYDGAYPY